MRQEVVWVLVLALGLRCGATLAVQTYLDRNNRDFVIAGDANGYWDTDAVDHFGNRMFPDGTYRLTVRGRDIRGNTSTRSLDVLVRNP